MPENRSEAFEGRYSFSNDKVQVRPKARPKPKSIIERPDNRENSFSSEPSWTQSSVEKEKKRLISEKKITPPVKVDTSGSSYYNDPIMRTASKYNSTASSNAYAHKISYGETLSDIAAKNNVSVDRLAQANKIKNPNRIYAGQKIYIPRGVNELDGPEASGTFPKKPISRFGGTSVGSAVVNKLSAKFKSLFSGNGKVGAGVDPSGIMSPDAAVKYRLAVERDNKKIVTNISEIKNAQTLLTNMGYNPNGIDGKIGGGTRRAVRKLQAQHGLPVTGALTPAVISLLKSSSVQEYPDKPDNTAKPIAFDAKDISIYSDVVAGIESGGEADPYKVMGGSGNSYVGKYQLGEDALNDLKYGYSPAKIKALLADPKKQEELFEKYTAKNHKELTRVSKAYRDMSKEEQLGVLGYAHNQGATAAAEFLFTGVVGSDAFDTKGTKYTKAVIEAFGWTAEGEKAGEENKKIVSDSFPELKEWSETSGKVGTKVAPPGVAIITPFAVKTITRELKPYAKLVTSTPAKYLIQSVTGWNKGEVLDENSLTDEELSVYKSIFNKKGTGLVTKIDYGIDNKTDPLQVRSGKDGSMMGLPANVSAYFSVGDTTLMKNDAGEVIVKDTYDYNFYTDYAGSPDADGKYPVVMTEDFEKNYTTAQGVAATIKAMTSGKIGKLSGFHNIGFLLGERGYKDSSKNEGAPIVINLGRPEDWD
tara:strand:- start:1505 stop:3613 length:2109 start_codon:yes stop_codon:yes gene_type:complete